MVLDQRKYERQHKELLRDIRPMYVRLADWLKRPTHSTALFIMAAGSFYLSPSALMFGDLIFLMFLIYFLWLVIQDRTLVFKLPYGSKFKDKNNMGPGKSGKAEGILYLGNAKATDEEAWFSNDDARTHVLYLGTTGSGKTEGLKSMVSNALSWGSGFVYIDGKADTDLWSSLSSLVRRFGRDDDLLVLNYMTGNSDTRAPSNTMNPFSSGSASYLTNMLVSLMPEAEGDNAMWKERAVSLISSIMPALTWKREHQEMPLSVSTIRESLNLDAIIKLSRDEVLPADITISLKSYLDTLPGYIDDAFDDDGKEKPPGPDQAAYDTTTPRQQHGYLSMQFTRALQSLGDDYGYIFDTQAADVDMVDVVLNRRILVVLIPALEKSSDETANLGKIVAATIKGMMGSTLGSTVEGEAASVIENKPTQSSTPFMVIFDEVGYYAAQGMAVMAAQARSLGFSLVFSAQDLPAMEKRVKEEARSITANCNIKIFGKLEDPTQTKEFFEKTVGTAMVMESSGFQLSGGVGTGSYYDTKQASLQLRARATYDDLRAFKEGEAVVAFGEMVIDAHMFFSNPGFAKAMRVTRFLALPPPDENIIKHANALTKVRDLMVHKTWTAEKADVALETEDEISMIAETIKKAQKQKLAPEEAGMAAVASVYVLHNPEALEEEETSGAASAAPTPVPEIKPETEKPVAASLEAVAPPPPVAPPLQKPPADVESSDDNPMAFFGKKKGDIAAEPPPETPQKEEALNWKDLINESTDTAEKISVDAEEQSTTVEKAQAPASVKLDPETERVMEKAGQDLKNSLFKTTGSDTDATE